MALTKWINRHWSGQRICCRDRDTTDRELVALIQQLYLTLFGSNLLSKVKKEKIIIWLQAITAVPVCVWKVLPEKMLFSNNYV